jgi:hypothetical protein
MIYKKFKIASQTITTKIVDHLPENDYGLFNDAENLILIARTIEKDGKMIELSESQQLNTWCHELIHVFQFYFNNDFDEAQAQVYANFICEMLETGIPYEQTN